ncbi:uncharacterized protein F4812DRAFT_449790 [Daldinia caldariorum]|uniref:uncharacterized protein n=1 Tax=Daldinia caldariorum TaxID=326644 RepID=UPI0020075E1A|nr:uncharacterized protein F4812DRAFT_449790 [Daldinia caldariorum]KAI1472015.1 hypothetical protein F4812DRAFT_449790 [Daldinia caldariorum]
MGRTMTTVALPRPIPPHRSSSGIVTLSSPIALETINAQQVSSAAAAAAVAPAPIPNKHIPVCPTGPAREPDTPPPSPGREHEQQQRHSFSSSSSSSPSSSSLLYPPDKFDRLESESDSGSGSGSLLCLHKISPADVAAALDHLSRQPLPDPALVFPWLHGLHPSNHIQQAFFTARSKSPRQTPTCLRGITLVKADGDLAVSRLKGAIAPAEFMQSGSSTGGGGGEFIDVDPKDGFSVRNFQIQAAKTAITSDIVVYGEDAGLVRKVAWEIASAQVKWRKKQQHQQHQHQHESSSSSFSSIPKYSTFICVSPFREFEEKHEEIVAVDSAGRLTGAVVDFFHQERLEMYAMTKATEISRNVWMGPTPESGSDEEMAYDVLLECSDLGRLNPGALQAIAENANHNSKEGKEEGKEGHKRRPYHLDFPSSGSILAPTWSHAEADGILDTCKWLWHLSHGTLPVARPDTDGDGDSNMSDASSSATVTATVTEVEMRPPRRILIHCTDGYTESTMLGIAYFSYSTGRPVAAAWMDLHTQVKRNFFAYPTDVSLLTSIAPRLLRESPVCGDKSLLEITRLVRDEPRWLAALDGSFPSRILDYMYLGNLGHANNPDLLRALGIRQLLSVGETATWRDGDLEAWGPENVLVVEKVQDNGIDPLTKEFEKCLEFIDRGRRNGTATLVHCRVGVSRSATICIAEVMRALDLSFPRAYCFVRARRLNVIIQPHLRFAYELLKWEEMLQLRGRQQQQQRAGNNADVAAANNAAAVGGGIRRELEWGEIAREIASMNRPYAR